MSKGNKILLVVLLAIGVFLIFGVNFHLPYMALLNPKGIIAKKQLSLMATATLVMLAVIIPVFIFTLFTVWKYREGNKNNTYSPNAKSNFFIGSVLWLLSITVIFTIGVLIWKSSHNLDPYKKLESNNKPITIQVVSLNWKWLFIYPEQNIATVNFVEFPANTPVHFELTSEGPMNSFWIPQLGGQAYAMAGMKNEINLMADEVGEFNGSPAEINGKGFSEMNFKAKAVSDEDFKNWVSNAKKSASKLTLSSFNELAKESMSNPVSYYSAVEDGLHNTIIMKYMPPIKEENMAEMPMHH